MEDPSGAVPDHPDRQWLPKPERRFDLGLEYVETETRSTGGNSNDSFEGTYEGNSPLVHMSFTIKF